MKTKLVLIGLALAASTTFAAAQNHIVKTTANQSNRSCFVDADKNGICDSFEKGTCTIGKGKGLMAGNGHGLMNGDGPRHKEGYRNGDGRRGRRR